MPDIVGVEAVNHFNEGFQDEGWLYSVHQRSKYKFLGFIRASLLKVNHNQIMLILVIDF